MTEQAYLKSEGAMREAREAAIRQRPTDAVWPAWFAAVNVDYEAGWNRAADAYKEAAQFYAVGDVAAGDACLSKGDALRRLLAMVQASADGRRAPEGAKIAAPPDAATLKALVRRSAEVNELLDRLGGGEEPAAAPRAHPQCLPAALQAVSEVYAAWHDYVVGDTSGGDAHLKMADSHLADYLACEALAKILPTS